MKAVVTKAIAKTEQYTGTVTEAKLVEAIVYDIDYSAKECYAKALKVVIETESGVVQFFSPSVEVTVNCPRGCPIAVVICGENDWIKKVETQQDKVIGERLVPRLNLGDLVTVSGRIKKSSGKCLTINYVKLVEHIPHGGQLPQKEYAFDDGDCITVYDASNQRKDTIHKNLRWEYLNSQTLAEILEMGYSFRTPPDAIERTKNNPTDTDGYWYNQLVNSQKTYTLGCWLDNRREKPVIKKRVIGTN